MQQETIQIKNLTIGYSSKNEISKVSENINASIKSGELTCLLGANGAGKSTLLKTLAAFLPKLNGEIFIRGKEIEQISEKELSQTIGVVLTERSRMHNLTVYELVAMGRSPYTGFWGRLNDEDKKIVSQSIALVNIEDLTSRMIHTLSDGERQKVMIAKTLAQETPVVYLDEPTAFLDFPSKVEIMQLLLRLTRETRKTIFLSTHDLELTLQIADKIWLMNKKEGITIGTPEDLAIQGYLGDFFKSKGFTFDETTGLFRIQHFKNQKIKLIGEGTKFAMIQKALQRIGVEANREINSEVYINSEGVNGKITFYASFENHPICFDSIEELLKQFQK